MNIRNILRPFHRLRKASLSTLNPPPPLPTCRCPCCGNRTLHERGGFEICPVCFWEDDGQDDEDADVVRGGPNGKLSLTQARKYYKEYGAADPRDLAYVRAAKPEELVERKTHRTPDDGHG